MTAVLLFLISCAEESSEVGRQRSVLQRRLLAAVLPVLSVLADGVVLGRLLRPAVLVIWGGRCRQDRERPTATTLQLQGQATRKAPEIAYR